MAVDHKKLTELTVYLSKLNLNREEVLQLNGWTRDELRRFDRQQSFAFRKGEMVEWDSDRRPGQTIRGRIITVNERTCTIQSVEHGRWRVGFSYLRKVTS